MTAGKTIVLTIQILGVKVMSLLFLIHCLGLSSLSCQEASFDFRAAVTLRGVLEPEQKSVTASSVSVCHEVMGPDAKILVFLILGFRLSHSPLSASPRGSFSSSLLSAIKVESSTIFQYKKI